MEILKWFYLVNSVLLIDHEIDSAYWKEWDLFKMRGGITGFLLVHFALLFLILYGLVAVWGNRTAGLYFSLLLGVSGIFAYCIHTFFIKRGHKEFTTKISLFILTSTLVVSLLQLLFTLLAFTR